MIQYDLKKILKCIFHLRVKFETLGIESGYRSSEKLN